MSEKTVPVPVVSRKAPAPKVIPLVLVPEAFKTPLELNEKVERFSVPVLSEKLETLRAAASVTVAPEALMVVPPIVLPALVMVEAARNVGLRPVNVPPADSVKFWYRETEPEAVQLLPVNVKALKPVPLKVRA